MDTDPSVSHTHGLPHPLAKVINRILRDRLNEYVAPKLEGLPQFAYTKGRGVLDALLRVHHHLRKARKIALESKASIYQQHQGSKSKTCAGGLCFSLDPEGAFDSVPRTQLAASVRRLHIPEDLIHMAMEFFWRASTTYLRRERLQRSQLANRVSDYLRQMSWP